MTIASVMKAPEANDHAALAETMPLDEIDVSNPALYQQHVWQPYFRRLRREAPVHYCKDSPIGPYWSVTKHKDIIALEVDHRRFSSSSTFGGITLRDRPAELELPMFIAMDPPKHDVQRKVVQPIVSPDNLANFEGLIRTRACATRSMACRAAKPSTGWIRSRSSSPARCWRPCSTSRSRTGASSATGRTSRPPSPIRAA